MPPRSAHIAASMLTAFAMTSCGGGEGPQGSLQFDNAWVRPPIAGRTTTAAYCDVTNRTDVAVVITGFASDNPGIRVELHETTDDGGMMRMRPLARVTIPPRATISFVPGGKHLMLFGFDGSDAEVKLAATLDGGESLPVVFTTRVEANP